MLTFLNPPGDNPNSGHYTKNLHEIITDENDLTDALKVDDVEKLEELNNLNINVFQPKADKTLTLTHNSEKRNKNEEKMKPAPNKSMQAILIMILKNVFKNVK